MTYSTKLSSTYMIVSAVLGEPIMKASIYSSIPMVLAGREHELPIIVVNTVEELYRTGNVWRLS